jgi:hypothetical protein
LIREALPKPETMLTYASILEKQQYVVKDNIKYPIPTGEVIEAACAALRYCAALPQSSFDARREEIARIIDPDAMWGKIVETGSDDNNQILFALKKADAILGLCADTPLSRPHRNPTGRSVMPILKNEVSKRLMRWMLPHTAPAPLSLDHPVQVDLAAAGDEIERFHTALIEILDAVDDMRLVNRLKEIERIATAALIAPALSLPSQHPNSAAPPQDRGRG